MEGQRWQRLSAPSRTVALEVLRHGPLSRSELARRLDLSPGSLTRLSRPLVESGVLVEGDQPHETPHRRPARPLVVADDAEHVVGVRLTGDRAWAVLTTLRADVVAVAEADLPDPSPGAVTAVVAGLVAHLGTGVPTLSGVGVGLGGQVRAGGVVGRAPYLGWSDVPLGRMLSRRTGLSTTVENDVVALTTAETWFGVGRRTAALAVVTIGTGIGLGLVHHGQVVSGPDAGVGLAAHLPLGLPGPRCPRGHVGCSAAVLEDDSIRAQAAATLRRPVGDEELLDLVVSGRHDGVNRLADDVAAGLGRLVALVADTALVPCVVVSGEGIALAELLQHRVRAEVGRHRDPAASEVEVVFRRSDGHRWARGAAAAAVQRYVTTAG